MFDESLWALNREKYLVIYNIIFIVSLDSRLNFKNLRKAFILWGSLEVSWSTG